jgi:hypothetical protein
MNNVREHTHKVIVTCNRCGATWDDPDAYVITHDPSVVEFEGGCGDCGCGWGAV